MNSLKKVLLIILGIILVAGSAYGGFYLFKRYVTQKSFLDSGKSKDTALSIPGFTRETNTEIPTVFPQGLIRESDIKSVLESFRVARPDAKTQHTYKYISIKDFNTNKNIFKKFITTNTVQVINSTDTEDSFSVFIKYNTDDLLISVNNVVSDVVVDITYIK